MKIFIDKSKCNNCKMCINICPVNAIEELNKIVDIDQTRCITCRSCLGVCRLGAIKIR